MGVWFGECVGVCVSVCAVALAIAKAIAIVIAIAIAISIAIGSRPHLGTDTARHSPRNASAGGDRCLRWGADK